MPSASRCLGCRRVAVNGSGIYGLDPRILETRDWHVAKRAKLWKGNTCMKKTGTWIDRFLMRLRQKQLALLAFALRGPHDSEKTFTQFCLSNCMDVGPTITGGELNLAWALGVQSVRTKHPAVGTDGSLDLILLGGSKAWWKYHPELHCHYDLIEQRSVIYVVIVSNSPDATRKTMVKLLAGSLPENSRASCSLHAPTLFHC